MADELLNTAARHNGRQGGPMIRASRQCSYLASGKVKRICVINNPLTSATSPRLRLFCLSTSIECQSNFSATHLKDTPSPTLLFRSSPLAHVHVVGMLRFMSRT